VSVAVAGAVALGGAVGAVLRYLVDKWAIARFGVRWPWGTLIVNVAGSLMLGLVLGTALAANLSQWWISFLTVGICGALTTFSGFALQIVELIGAPLARHVDNQGNTTVGLLRGTAYTAVSLGLGLLVAVSVPLVVDIVNSGHAVN
jgi:fluoride exporter